MTSGQIIEEIYQKLERFKNSNNSGRRQYLAAAAQLYEIEERMSEILNSEEDFNMKELEEINEKADKILKNLGIAFEHKS